MAVLGKLRSYHKKFNFSIEIDGLDIAWFESMSELSAEVGVVEQHEGGSLVVASQEPGKVKYSPVTLKAGVTDNNDLYDWWVQVIDGAGNGGTGTGEVNSEYKKNIAIVQKDRDGSELKRWNLFEAWPNKFSAGDWDAKAEDNVMEEVTLTYKRFEKG